MAVIDPCMDDFGVAGTGFCADGAVALDQEGGGVGFGGELAGDCEADDAGADDGVGEVDFERSCG